MRPIGHGTKVKKNLFEGVRVERMRFSLLLLDDDEAYIEDHSATHFFGDEAHKGRLRVATKSLFFEPELLSLPILRFPFAKVLQLGELRERCVVVTSEVTEMRKNGKHYPYVFLTGKRQHAFSMDFLRQGSLTAYFLLVGELLRCSKLPAPQARVAVSLMVARHRDAAKSFSLSSLVDFNEELLTDVMCCRIKPFIVQPSRFVVTTKRLYLQPVDDLDGHKYVLDLNSVSQVFRRRHSLREVGIELLMKNGKTLFLTFGDMSQRDSCHNLILNHPIVLLALNRDSSDAVTAKWVAGEMSNFDYLMFVNSLADRTRNDLAQYPVFPWVLSEYSGATLEISNPNVYRDLSKPIGALNPQRLEMYRKRMRDMPHDGQEFLYGTHFSTPGYVLFYLVRKRPDLMLRLQNGKFDAPDRAFFSVAAAWSSCLNSQTDVKELIPEFFSDPTMFENTQNLDLGTRQNGARVGDVELPPWCHNDAKKFVALNREALESEIVSRQLHLWIDLIFGCRQRDKASDNVFYPLTYQGNVDVARMEDDELRQSIELQINEFGQTPKQVFFSPHPKRFSKYAAALSAASSAAAVLNKEPSFLSGSLNDLLGARAAVVVTSKPSLAPNTGACAATMWDLEGIRRRGVARTMPRLHRETVSGLDCNGDQLVSVARDCFVKVHVRDEVEGLKQTRASNVAGVPLTCCQMLSDDLVLVGALDSKVYSYSIQFGKCIDSLLAHDDSVSALRYCNGRLVTGGWDTLVRLWEVRDGATVQKMAHYEVQDVESCVQAVDVASNGVFVATGGSRVVVGDFRIPNKVVRIVEADDFGSASATSTARLLNDDGMRALIGNSVLNLGDGSWSPLLLDEEVGAMDVSGSLALVAVESRVELWDCIAQRKLTLVEKDPSFAKNNDRVSAIAAKGDCLYAATDKGALLWL